MDPQIRIFIKNLQNIFSLKLFFKLLPLIYCSAIAKEPAVIFDLGLWEFLLGGLLRVGFKEGRPVRQCCATGRSKKPFILHFTLPHPDSARSFSEKRSKRNVDNTNLKGMRFCPLKELVSNSKNCLSIHPYCWFASEKDSITDICILDETFFSTFLLGKGRRARAEGCLAASCSVSTG